MYTLAEYEALRATVRERGTARMCIILAGLATWAVLALALNAAEFDRAASLVPFLVMAATFEISFFIHTGVERVGRYIQVFYEEKRPPNETAEPASWETAIMAYGRTKASGLDPLFTSLFVLIAAVDFFAAFPAAVRHWGWAGISLLAHLIFVWRLAHARRLAANQRNLDLERFRAIRNSSPASN